jgi:ribosome maturation factor RimP
MIVTIKESIEKLAANILQEYNVFLIDVEVKGTSQSPLVTVFVDKEDEGVGIDTCAKISREIVFLIEAQNIIEDKFTINVSSPGLDRPLSDVRQYPKNVGRKAKVTRQIEDKKTTIKGKLTSVSDHGISVEPDKGEAIVIPWQDILETKIIPAF